jgi:hypothetical protein
VGAARSTSAAAPPLKQSRYAAEKTYMPERYSDHDTDEGGRRQREMIVRPAKGDQVADNQERDEDHGGGDRRLSAHDAAAGFTAST